MTASARCAAVGPAHAHDKPRFAEGVKPASPFEAGCNRLAQLERRCEQDPIGAIAVNDGDAGEPLCIELLARTTSKGDFKVVDGLARWLQRAIQRGIPIRWPCSES